MILIYTGDAKGKTSAAIGQAVRALGRNMHVAFVQYMKREGVGGEQAVLASLLGEKFRAGGVGFLTGSGDFEKHRKAARELTAWVHTLLPDLDMLVLDEALYALNAGLVTEGELRGILAACKASDTHIVLSGRHLPVWLHDMADLVTEMREIKHPHTKGTAAIRGIEF